jgi:hypothetical protein
VKENTQINQLLVIMEYNTSIMADRLPRGVDASAAMFVAHGMIPASGKESLGFERLGAYDRSAPGGFARLGTDASHGIPAPEPGIIVPQHKIFDIPAPITVPPAQTKDTLLVAHAGDTPASGAPQVYGNDQNSLGSQGQTPADDISRQEVGFDSGSGHYNDGKSGTAGGRFTDDEGDNREGRKDTDVDAEQTLTRGEYQIPRLRIRSNFKRVSGAKGIMRDGLYRDVSTYEDGSLIIADVTLLEHNGMRDEAGATASVDIQDPEGRPVVGVRRKMSFPKRSGLTQVTDAASHINEGNTRQPARWVLAGMLEALSPVQFRQVPHVEQGTREGSGIYLLANEERSSIPLLPIPENLHVIGHAGNVTRPTYYRATTDYEDSRLQVNISVMQRDTASGPPRAAAVDVQLHLTDTSGRLMQITDSIRYRLPYNSKDQAIAEVATQASEGESDPAAKWSLERSLIALSTPFDAAHRIIFVPTATIRDLTTGIAVEDRGRLLRGEYAVISEEDFEQLEKRANKNNNR